MILPVLTFNLRVDIPQDGKNAWAYRSKKAAELIKKYEPFVFGTQEGLLHMVTDLEKDLTDYGWVGEGREGGENNEFCAIFYHKKWLEVVENGQFWLSEQPSVPNSTSWESSYPRICTWATFKLKSNHNKKFIVFNTHLDHLSQSARENGIQLIGEEIKRHHAKTQLPVILMGDFNSEPENVVIRFIRGLEFINGSTIHLQDAFEKLKGPPGRTFHGFNGGIEGKPIDYIFATNDIVMKDTKIIRSKLDEIYPSDHFPVVTSIEI